MTATAVVGLFAILSSGCRHGHSVAPSPASVGFNTRDLIDPVAQKEADDLTPADHLLHLAEQLRKERQEKFKKEGPVAESRPDRNVLCLSGGGALGAHSVGVLVGWTERGDRPPFDVVTGISTGALIAPLAFLGSKYDDQLREFYTNREKRDLFRIRPWQGLFGEALADNSRMAAQVNAVFSPEFLQELADAHRQGRRLYIGTTEMEGKRFIVWDIGAMACRNGPGDRELILQVVLASAAIPGLFPSSKINVSVDGTSLTERHADGGVSQNVFFRAPYVPPEERSDKAVRDLTGVKVYVVVAGKLYADPEVVQPRALTEAGKSVSTLLYAQTRGDLKALYTLCVLAGMDFHLMAISPAYAASPSALDFKREVMADLFEEGRRAVRSPTPWRRLPPGAEPDETVLNRSSRDLTYQPRGPLVPIKGPKGTRIPPQVPIGIGSP
jgi:predicted acylesterase/phospholipase RssA